MFIRDFKKCRPITAGDNTSLRELFNPIADELQLHYSLAYAKIKPGKISFSHKLKSSEIYYILEGEGEIYIDKEKEKVRVRLSATVAGIAGTKRFADGDSPSEPLQSGSSSAKLSTLLPSLNAFDFFCKLDGNPTRL